MLEEEDFFDKALDNPVLKTAKGGLYEALIADMLIKGRHSNIFFYRNEPGTVEIEFLIENAFGVLPIEVKAGRNTILKNEDIKYGLKLADQNIGVSEKKITMPLYMAIFI